MKGFICCSSVVVRRKRLTKQLAAWALCSLACSSSSIYAYTQGAWLYEVDVPVSAQSEQARTTAASAGLLRVLTRITGLASVPRNAQIVAALSHPEAYYNAFNFIGEADTRTEPV